MKMTNEEAIIDIRENIQHIVGGKSLDIAISAIKKQMPKKPTGIYDENESEKGKGLYEEALIGSCPVCHQEVQLGMKYCMNCGQALDWSDIE